MIIKIRKYVATVSEFVEHEDGTITKEVREITLEGTRFKPACVRNRIPHDARLLESGWRETVYEVNVDKLEKFCMENGTPVFSLVNE